MWPELFTIGGSGVSSYQTLLALGFLLATLLAARLAERDGIERPLVFDLAIGAIIAGLLGSRIFYFVEFYDRHFRGRPWYHALYVHEGGYVFFGGFIAATIVVSVHMAIYRARRLRAGLPSPSVLRLLDAVAPGVPVGLALGRVGCFLNGCCWGLPSAGPLAVCFPPGSLPFASHVERHGLDPAAAHSLPVHPAQLYEAGLVLGVLGALLLARRHRWRVGQLSGLWLALHGPVRFFIEGLREHDATHEMRVVPVLGLVTNSQLVSVGIAAIGVAWLVAASLRGEPIATPERPRAA